MIDGIQNLKALRETTTNALLKNAIDYILSNLSINTTQSVLSKYLKEVEHITNKASASDKLAFEGHIRTLNEELPGDIITNSVVYTPQHATEQLYAYTHQNEKTPLLGKDNKKEKKSKLLYF